MCEVTGDNQPVVANKRSSGCADSFLAIASQRNVRCARMLAIDRPFGLAVADNENSRCWHIGVVFAKVEG